MSDSNSKYGENQFESATRGRPGLMGELIADVMPKITAAAAIHPELVNARNLLISLEAAWNATETIEANLEAARTGATAAFENKLDSLTQSTPEANSPLETWDLTLAGQAPYHSPLYKTLLPRGRETLTGGTYDQRLDALRDFAARLAAQAGKPILITLGGTVTTFYNAAKGFRDTQNAKKAGLDLARQDTEGVRKLLAAEIFAMTGDAMRLWKNEPEKVDTLYDINILRDPTLTAPTTPLDIFWDAATRTLRTTALPEGTTRLEFWREGPGGMPELLAIGERGALSVQIPATITFRPGDHYQLWLQARNSRGSSPAGPKVSWTAA